MCIAVVEVFPSGYRLAQAARLNEENDVMMVKQSLALMVGLALDSRALAADAKKAEPKTGTSTTANADADVKQRWRELKDAAERLGQRLGKDAAQATDEAKNDLSTLEKKIDEVGKDIDAAAKEGGAKVQKDVGGALNDLSHAIGELGKKVQGAGTSTSTGHAK